MLLKCETTLNVYQHKDKIILCRVLPTDGKNRENQTTCRSMTTDQWYIFDREFSCWLENNDCELDEQLCKFNVTPNLEVKIRKSKVPAKRFFQCVRNGDNCEELSAENSPLVLDCSLEFKCPVSKLPPTPSIPMDEYEPIPSTGIKNESTSPLSYEPYTPSKRLRSHSTINRIKTPGVDFLGFDSAEDTYSPKPVAPIVNTADDAGSTNGTQSTVPTYKPAPISEKRLSQDSQQSNLNEAILETDDELSRDGYRSRRTRLKTKIRKQRDHGEYIPESQDIAENVPAYNPTPIEDKKQKDLEVPNKTETIADAGQASSPQKERKKPETCDEGKKHNVKKDKSSNETKASSSSRESKRSSNTAPSSDDEFKNDFRKRNDRDNKKKDSVDKPHSSSSKDKDKERKTKEKRKSKETTDGKDTKRDEQPTTEMRTTYTSLRKHTSTEKSPPHQSSSAVRRSARSPSKPLRFIEEDGNYDLQKKSKSLKSSSTHMELFGTDDDEDCNKKRSDSNNNASNKTSVFHTPRCDKKNTSLTLSSSSSSSAKKKRKRNDCEQEKAGLNKWLGKIKDHGGTSETSKEKSASSINEKSSKKIKSSTDDKCPRPKSTSPQRMDIVMPSKEEMELLRDKHKRQREENEKFKAVLEKISVPPPKEVQQLSLKDMTLNDLLDTFNIYKNDLDKIYEKNRKKDHVKGNDGINHCLVIGLTDQIKQLKMLEKLSDVYKTANSTTQATLYANALLPEWIIRVFMQKYNMSRLQAITQIQDQDAYTSYIESQNENSLLFDD